jgi:hypothetical protein
MLAISMAAISANTAALITSPTSRTDHRLSSLRAGTAVDAGGPSGVSGVSVELRAELTAAMIRGKSAPSSEAASAALATSTASARF